MSRLKINNERDRLTTKILAKDSPRRKKALMLLALIDNDVPEVEANKILSIAKKLID